MFRSSPEQDAFLALRCSRPLSQPHVWKGGISHQAGRQVCPEWPRDGLEGTIGGTSATGAVTVMFAPPTFSNSSGLPRYATRPLSLDHSKWVPCSWGPTHLVCGTSALPV